MACKVVSSDKSVALQIAHINSLAQVIQVPVCIIDVSILVAQHVMSIQNRADNDICLLLNVPDGTEVQTWATFGDKVQVAVTSSGCFSVILSLRKLKFGMNVSFMV